MNKINIDPKNKLILDAILIQYPYRFFAYGSRVTALNNHSSDLDLCVMGMHDYDAYLHLKTVLQESDLRFKIDLNRWEKLSEEFKVSIKDSLIAYVPDLFLGAQIISLTKPIEFIDRATRIRLNKSLHIAQLQNYSLAKLTAACIILDTKETLVTHELLVQIYGDIGIKNSWQDLWLVIMSPDRQLMNFTMEAMDFLIAQNLKGLAISAAISDDISMIFLKHNILIVENLNYLPLLNNLGYLIITIWSKLENLNCPARVDLVMR